LCAYSKVLTQCSTPAPTPSLVLRMLTCDGLCTRVEQAISWRSRLSRCGLHRQELRGPSTAPTSSPSPPSACPKASGWRRRTSYSKSVSMRACGRRAASKARAGQSTARPASTCSSARRPGCSTCLLTSSRSSLPIGGTSTQIVTLLPTARRFGEASNGTRLMATDCLPHQPRMASNGTRLMTTECILHQPRIASLISH
jgi:hypothetical protein